MEMNAQKGGRGKAQVKNIYARGADDGFWLGLYLAGLFAVSVLSLNVAVLNPVAFAMMCAVPFLTYFYLRRTHKAAHGMTLFSALWMQGITMFVCASLIFGLVSFVYLRWIDGGFLERVLRLGMEYYGSVPSESAQAMSDELRMVLESGAMPSASMIVMVWMWLIMFGGALLSLAVSVVVRMMKVRRD